MAKTLPLVTIIIPVYKVEKYLKEAVDSAVNQTYKNLEIILVDDGSPDNCGKTCDEYSQKDNRVKVIHKPNGGLCSARNAGIEEANGEWIYFMDSDDYIEKDLIEITLNTVISDNSDMCFFNYERFYKKSIKAHQTLKSSETTFKNTNDLKTLKTYFSEWGCAWSYIIKSDIIKGKLKFNESVKYLEDELFKFQLYDKIASFSYVHKAFYHYRVVPTSITGTIAKSNDYLDMIKKVYNGMVKAIENGSYPENAAIIANTRFLERFCVIVQIAFKDKFSFKCDFDMIKKYLNSSEYKQSLENYDKENLNGRANKLYLLKNNPNRLFITLIYLLTKIKLAIRKV